MTVTEAAAKWGLSARRVRAMIASGSVKASKAGPIWIIKNQERPAKRTRGKKVRRKSPPCKNPNQIS